MRFALALTASVLLTGCATPAEPAPPPPGPVANNGNDCAVIAAVAKEHFQFGPDNPPPPVRWGPDFEPNCDWGRYGLAFTPYEERSSDGRVRPWVRFDKPRYDSQGALIEVGIMRGTRNGEGSDCRVRSGFAGWTVTGCSREWAS